MTLEANESYYQSQTHISRKTTFEYLHKISDENELIAKKKNEKINMRESNENLNMENIELIINVSFIIHL